MPSRIFSAARIMSLEKKLLSKSDIHRLVSMDHDGAVKLLHEKGYGGANAASTDIEELIEGELSLCGRLVRELTSDEKITDAFFMRTDVRNLKLLIKLRLQGRSLDEAHLEGGGVTEPKLLALMVKAWEFGQLPEIISRAIKDIDEDFAQRRDPQTVSVMLDRAYFSYVRSLGDAFLSEYFGVECDFINVICALRMKKYEADGIMRLMMPEYRIPVKKIAKQLAEGDIVIRELARDTEGEESKTLLALSRDSLQIQAVEKARDDCLMAIARRDKNNMESLAPVIWYNIAKQRESDIIRLVVTLKRNGVKNADIEERLRELYG